MLIKKQHKVAQTAKTLVCLFFILASLSTYANKTQGLDIKLLSENSSIAAGSTFTVGVSIHHHEGYHTYWRNPGIVGMATNIKWTLPPGFTAESIEWPYPELSSMAGHPCHGYERDVTLLVKINAPKVIREKEIKLRAGITWMCCAKNCFPGSKEFTLSLPVTSKPSLNKENVQIFTTARKELPQKNNPWKVSILSKANQSMIQLRLDPKQTNSPAPEYIFSNDGQISSNKKQRFIKQKDGSFLLSIERPKLSPKSPTHLAGVLKAGNSSFSFIAPYTN